MPIKTVIADRDFLIKRGLKCLFKDYADIELTGQASNMEELKRLLRLFLPDVLIMDFNQEGVFSLDDVAKLKKCYPETNILIISDNRHKHDILTAMQIGITSYLLKECGEDEIIEAIEATAKGEQFFCAQVLENILGRKSPKQCEGLFLTDREIEIVKLVAEGYTTADISSMLCRSVHTINTHRKNILNKLGLASPSELVLYAVKNGLVAA